jgi:release factor glutamine methyltransferase
MADDADSSKRKADEMTPEEEVPEVPDELKSRVKVGKEEFAAMEIHLMAKSNSMPERTISIAGKDFLIAPGVFGDDVFGCSGAAVKCCEMTGLFKPGGSFLDMGTGCGVVAIFAALGGCGHVAAVDVYEHAIENTRRNAEKHGVKVDGRVSNIFSGLADEKFDTIFWNYGGGDMFEGSLEDHHANALILSDPGHALLRRFLTSAPGHLKPGGRVVTAFEPQFGNMETFQQILMDTGMTSKRICVVKEMNPQGFEVDMQYFEYGTLLPAGGDMKQPHVAL